MARILFGLCSVGLGHAIRSRTILEHLIKKNEVFILTSNESFAYLSNYFKNIHEIPGFELAFKRNKVLTMRTILKNLKKINPKNIAKINQVYKEIKTFNPELVISDWEPFSSLVARKLNLKLVSLDNQHYLMFGSYSYPKKYWLQRLKAAFIIKYLMKKPDSYLVMTLPKQKLKRNRNTIRINPVLRKPILSAIPKKRDYILVYQSTKTYARLFSMLKKIPGNFIVYGYNVSKRDRNLTFRSFNDKRKFFNDLVNCRAVITNGGFTLISEAIHLKKPILTVPIKKHFEQILNSLYVKNNSLGECYTNLTERNIRSFIKDLDSFKTVAAHQRNNRDFYDVLDRTIGEMVRK